MPGVIAGTNNPNRQPVTRGTARFDPSSTYVGGVYNDPNTWASDQDHAMYAASVGAPKPGPNTGNYLDPQGLSHPFATDPNVATNQYATDANGTKVNGQGTISSGAYEGQQKAQLDAQLKSQQMEQQAKLQADAEARRLGYLSTVTGQQPAEVPGQVGPAANEEGARSAAFARAKEQAGSTALASLKSLQSVMESSGKVGSSVEGNMKAAIIGGGAHDINDFTRTQLMSDLNRAADVSDRNYQGKITQRGQNLSMMPSLMGLITASGGVY